MVEGKKDRKYMYTIWLWTEDTISALRLENLLKHGLGSDLIYINVESTAEDYTDNETLLKNIKEC